MRRRSLPQLLGTGLCWCAQYRGQATRLRRQLQPHKSGSRVPCAREAIATDPTSEGHAGKMFMGKRARPATEIKIRIEEKDMPFCSSSRRRSITLAVSSWIIWASLVGCSSGRDGSILSKIAMSEQIGMVEAGKSSVDVEKDRCLASLKNDNKPLTSSELRNYFSGSITHLKYVENSSIIVEVDERFEADGVYGLTGGRVPYVGRYKLEAPFLYTEIEHGPQFHRSRIRLFFRMEGENSAIFIKECDRSGLISRVEITNGGIGS